MPVAVVSPLMGLVMGKAVLDSLATIPVKIRTQLVKKAKSLLSNPKPQGCKQLKGIVTKQGDPVYRVRSGDYRILYILRSDPGTVIVLDIDARKDVYR